MFILTSFYDSINAYFNNKRVFYDETNMKICFLATKMNEQVCTTHCKKDRDLSLFQGDNNELQMNKLIIFRFLGLQI